MQRVTNEELHQIMVTQNIYGDSLVCLTRWTFSEKM